MPPPFFSMSTIVAYFLCDILAMFFLWAIFRRFMVTIFCLYLSVLPKHEMVYCVLVHVCGWSGQSLLWQSYKHSSSISVFSQPFQRCTEIVQDLSQILIFPVESLNYIVPLKLIMIDEAVCSSSCITVIQAKVFHRNQLTMLTATNLKLLHAICLEKVCHTFVPFLQPSHGSGCILLLR